MQIYKTIKLSPVSVCPHQLTAPFRMCSTKMYHPASFPPNADNLWKMSFKCKITNYFLTLQAQRCWSDFCFVNIIIRRFIIAMRRANSLFAALASCCYPIQLVPLLSSPSLLVWSITKLNESKVSKLRDSNAAAFFHTRAPVRKLTPS